MVYERNVTIFWGEISRGCYCHDRLFKSSLLINEIINKPGELWYKIFYICLRTTNDSTTKESFPINIMLRKSKMLLLINVLF